LPAAITFRPSGVRWSGIGAAATSWIVVEDLVDAGGHRHVAVLGLEVGQLLGVIAVGVDIGALAPAPLDRGGHAHDVVVVEADHRELDLVLGGQGRSRRSDLLGESVAGDGHATQSSRQQKRPAAREIVHRVYSSPFASLPDLLWEEIRPLKRDRGNTFLVVGAAIDVRKTSRRPHYGKFICTPAALGAGSAA
jgi:hypothetical protein